MRGAGLNVSGLAKGRRFIGKAQQHLRLSSSGAFKKNVFRLFSARLTHHIGKTLLYGGERCVCGHSCDYPESAYVL